MTKFIVTYKTEDGIKKVAVIWAKDKLDAASFIMRNNKDAERVLSAEPVK